jgi:Cu/Zn superoxide dismutase
MELRSRQGRAGVVITSAWLALNFAAACQPAEDTPEGAAYEAPPASGVGAAGANEPDTLLTTVLESADSTAAPGLSGEVAVVAGDDVDEPLELVVRGSGLPPGEHAWHVHTGPCGTDGPVRIPISETATAEGTSGPLEVNAQGEFDEAVEIPELNRTMVGTQGHSLHIHRNPGANHGPTVACATI